MMNDFNFISHEEFAIDASCWSSEAGINRFAAYLNYLEDEAQNRSRHDDFHLSAIREIPDHVA